MEYLLSFFRFKLGDSCWMKHGSMPR